MKTNRFNPWSIGKPAGRATLAAALGLCLLATPVLGVAQMGDGSAKSDAAVIKMLRVELLHQILPVLLKKDQYRKLLQPIEQCRKRFQDLQKSEATELLRLDARLDAAINDAKAKTISPPRDLMDEISKVIYASRMGRQICAEQNTDDVFKVFMAITDVGQQRAAANSLDPRAFGMEIKPEELTQEKKVRFFVSEVLLHPQAYPILVYFSKDKPDG